MRTLFLEMAQLDPADPRLEVLMKTIQRHLASMSKDTKGVRLDLVFTLPDGRSFALDFTGVHPTSKAAMKQVPTFIRANKLASEAASGVVINPHVADTVTSCGPRNEG